MNHDDILKEHIEKFTGKTVNELKEDLTKPFPERGKVYQQLSDFVYTHSSLDREMVEDFIGIPKDTISKGLNNYNKNYKGKWKS